MKKFVALFLALVLCLSLSAVSLAEDVTLVNGFLPFTPGGLLGGEGGEYHAVTVEAVGENAVRFSGKGGLSWPDTVNMPLTSAMGGYYHEAVALDGLTLTWKLDQAMNFGGDHWYVIALEDRCELFNSWDGGDPCKTLFLMIALENGKIGIRPHYRDVVDLGAGWNYLGLSQGVEYNPEEPITLTFTMTEDGLNIAINGELQTYDVMRSANIGIVEELFPDGQVWVMGAAHIGNPGEQFEGEYAFTLGLGE